MPASRTIYKRRHFFIKKGFQVRFMLLFCLLILFWGGLSACLVFYLSKGDLTSWFTSSGLAVTDTAVYLLPTILLTNLIATILIAISTIVVTLFVSHKIAGPIFRLEKDIDVIAKGDLSFRVKFRKGDQLKEYRRKSTKCRRP